MRVRARAMAAGGDLLAFAEPAVSTLGALHKAIEDALEKLFSLERTATSCASGVMRSCVRPENKLDILNPAGPL